MNPPRILITEDGLMMEKNRIQLRINIDVAKASNLTISSEVLPAADVYVFSVAQIFNLPYRRFVIGRTLLARCSSQVKNLRYGRLQVCATGAACTLLRYTNVSSTNQARRVSVRLNTYADVVRAAGGAEP